MKDDRGDARRAIDAIGRFAGGGYRPLAQSTDVVVDRGAGSYLFTSTGGRYLDVVSGYGVASLGHSHPRWVEAVISQASRLTVSPLHTGELAAYLAALAAILPSKLQQTALCSTGAEAVEMAMRLAQTERGRPGVLTFVDGFHGKTNAVRYTREPCSPEARALGPNWLHTSPFPACEQHDAVNYRRCQESVSDAIKLIAAREDLDDVAAVLVEPVLGTSGNIVPRRRFLTELRRLCDERDWLLVFDEAITGFGRTGRMFAFEYFGVEPDVLILSKGLGGGFPLSAVCASSELWDGSALEAPSATASSYGGNPLACAAGMVTLEIVTGADFLESVGRTGAHAARRLRELADAAKCVARPRGIGLMLGFDLVNPNTGALATAPSCDVVFRDCRDRGVLTMTNVPRVRLSPPLTISMAEVDILFDVLLEVLV